MPLNLRILSEYYETAEWISRNALKAKTDQERTIKFQQLKKHLSELSEWVYQNTLGYIDQGSSRDTYRLSPKLVLKLAWGSSLDTALEIAEESPSGKLPGTFYQMIARGVGQNKAEVNSAECAEPEVITNVTKADSKFFWIIQEYAEPIRSNDEFLKLTGISFPKLIDLIRGYSDRERPGVIRKDPHFSENPWFLKLVKTIKNCGISWTDLIALEHFGYIGKRVVLLDHGGTKKVLNRLYEYIRLVVRESLEEQIPVGPPSKPGMAGYQKKIPGATKPLTSPVGTADKTVAAPLRPKQSGALGGAEDVSNTNDPDELLSAIQSRLGSIQDPAKLRQILSLMKN